MWMYQQEIVMHIEYWLLATLVVFSAVGLASIVLGAVRIVSRRVAMREAIAAMKAFSGGTDNQLRTELKELIRRNREALGVWA
jgi:hypothetical protein